jgi:hypothetical protein
MAEPVESYLCHTPMLNRIHDLVIHTAGAITRHIIFDIHVLVAALFMYRHSQVRDAFIWTQNRISRKLKFAVESNHDAAKRVEMDLMRGDHLQGLNVSKHHLDLGGLPLLWQ